MEMISTSEKEGSMPSDREVRDRRHEAIREILLNETPVQQQRDLVDRLRARGFAATQSNVSRDLRELGAVRVDGNYRIPSWLDDGDSPFRQVVHLIRGVKPAGPYQTLLVTERGAGALVAQAIEDDQWEDLVGTLSGHSSVLLLTEHSFFQKLVYERLKHYMSQVGRLVFEELPDLGEKKPGEKEKEAAEE
jgi:transcriptional regulator of arginine metabolism